MTSSSHDATAKTLTVSQRVALPPTVDWQSPLCWAGDPPKPVNSFDEPAPRDAVFVRGTARLVVSRRIGEGMTRSAEVSRGALIQFQAGRPIAVHLKGLGGRSWTYWQVREGRKKVWKLHIGLVHPAMEPVEGTPIAPEFIEYLYVHSLIPMAATGRLVSFMIRDDGTMEDFTKVVDPDAGD